MKAGKTIKLIVNILTGRSFILRRIVGAPYFFSADKKRRKIRRLVVADASDTARCYNIYDVNNKKKNTVE
jgi:hypothetical protein